MNAFRGIAVRGCVSPYLASLSLAISAERPWRVVCTVSTFRAPQWPIIISCGVTRRKRSARSDRKEIPYHPANLKELPYENLPTLSIV